MRANQPLKSNVQTSLGWVGWVSASLSAGYSSGAAGAPRAQAQAAQDPRNGAARRRVFQTVLHLQNPAQLLRAPRAMQPALGDNQRLHLFIGAMRAAVRAVAAGLPAPSAHRPRSAPNTCRRSCD